MKKTQNICPHEPNLNIWPWCCVLRSVMRFLQRQTPCCEPPDRYPLRVSRTFLKRSLIGRWSVPASGDASCMATWCPRHWCLHLRVLSRFISSKYSWLYSNKRMIRRNSRNWYLGGTCKRCWCESKCSVGPWSLHTEWRWTKLHFSPQSRIRRVCFSVKIYLLSGKRMNKSLNYK